MGTSRITLVLPEKKNRRMGRDGIVGSCLKDRYTRPLCLQTQFPKVFKLNTKNACGLKNHCGRSKRLGIDGVVGVTRGP